MALRHFHRIFVLVDGQEQERIVVEPAALDEKVAAAAAQIFTPGKTTGRAALHVLEAPLSLQWTAQGSAAITTIFNGTAPTLMSVLLAGLKPEFESEIAKLWVDSVRKNPSIAALGGGGPAAFEQAVTYAERPLCVSVLVPTLNQDDCLAVLDWHDHLAAAFFSV